MIIDLSPDYNKLLNIFLVYFVIKSILYILVGLAQSDIPKRGHFGIFDIVSGIVGLLLVAWVVI